VKVIKGNEAFTEALLKEPPRTWGLRAITLYLACVVGFFCSTCNGFDGSLFNSLLENDAFKEYFHVKNVGIFTGIVTSMYQIGSVVAIPFIGPAIDTWGRKVGMSLGAICIILGTVIQGTTTHTHSIGQFMGGRFFLGFGVSIVSSAGPMYVVEVSHPAHRGILTAIFNTFWYVCAQILTMVLVDSL
jgi:MFS family permease